VVAIGEDATAPVERTVDGTCDPNGKPADAAGQSLPVVGLDDEVDVIVLDAELQDAKPRVRRCAERASHGAKNAVGS